MLFLLIFVIWWISTSFYYQSWKHIYEMWELKRDKVKIHYSNQKSDYDLFDDLDKKDSWYIRLRLNIQWKIEAFLNFPRNIYRFFKRGIQRWARGWCDEDVWSIDYHLTNILSSMLKHLKKTKTGVPSCVGKMTTEKEFEEAKKQWDEILDTILYTFETAKKIQDRDFIYVEREKDRIKHQNLVKRLNCRQSRNRLFNDIKYYLMSKEECKKYRKGWFYFQKFFFSLRG